MPGTIMSALFACCLLMQAATVLAEQQRPDKPIKVEERHASEPKALPARDEPKPANPLVRLKAGTPKASTVASRPLALPGPDLGLGCAKDE